MIISVYMPTNPHCSCPFTAHCSWPLAAHVPSLLMSPHCSWPSLLMSPHCSCPLTLFISPHCSCPLTAHGHSLLMSPHCLWPLAAHVPPLLMNVPSLLMSNHTAHVPSLLMAPPCSLTMSAKHNENGKVTIWLNNSQEGQVDNNGQEHSLFKYLFPYKHINATWL